ncbi:SGNH/GDSL hydrolase family protein [Roseateles koreensis]|uniref:SGNH/GDSL hydrolase family protein n=1 Tax=Roseateles koreensis TaxID=2987526 RepID=A0ABT5KUA9_9BURK|nr:SGNH/GDSL hydrolase family protein [Roseateles koreensis]MDC8786523.1 SGNH/GDSL hydrolase family protein [Roseateles koreensis]
MKRFEFKYLALAASLALAACGGGGTADTSSKLKISTVKVFGDSLADSGTFGIKFTVQAADTLIYPERVAASYGLSLCNFYVFTGTTFAANSKAGCSNFAIGGGVINMSNAADPRGIPLQLATAGSMGFSATDLAVIDGGGNDAAALIGAYLNAPKDSAAAYSSLLLTLLTPAQVTAALTGGATTTAAIGTTYMTALADKFYASIKASVLDKGAQQVVVLNMPGVTNTPRFQMVLDAISAAYGGGTAGAAARAQSEALFKSWMAAYNTELDAKFAGESRVAVVDFYTAFNDQIANASQYGLTNVKTPACPITGVDSSGLPTYTFSTCTATALSAAPPTGVTGADWWKSYAFSDSFHPTPYGHQLTAQLISKTLAIKGWL